MRMWATGSSAWAKVKVSSQGFTLVELMVVLTILVLCSTLIPLSISRSLPGRRVANASDQIRAVLLEAQARSITSGKIQRIEVAEHELRIVAVDASSTGNQVKAMTTTLSPSTALVLDSLTGQAMAVLQLYPDGSSDGGTFKVSDGSRHATITVSSLTGHVQVHKGV